MLLIASPGLAAFAVFLYWGAHNGGYAVTAWLPGALFLLGVALLLIGGVPRLRPEWGTANTAAVGLFGAFTLWTFLSIAWAGVKGDAWDGANRTLLYFIVFLIFSRPMWTVPRAVTVLLFWALGAVLVGSITLQSVIHSAHPVDSFIGSRLSEPFGYANGTAAFFLMPVWPMLAIASRREQHPALRAVCLGTAGFLAELGFVPESRGMLFAFPLAIVAYVALAPNRLRALVPLTIVLLSGALINGRLLGVFRAHGGEALREATVSARNGIVVTAIVLVVVGFAYALLDRRLVISPETARRLSLGFAALVVAVVLVSGVVALATAHPVRQAEKAWRDFKSPAEPQGHSSHFGGLGSNRYDFWRVSTLIFRDHPVQGVGVDNFAVEYLKLGRSREQPRYPHSIEMGFLTGTGLVGVLLFASFLVVAGIAALRRADPVVRGVSAGALGATAYWLLHGSGDWLWEFPSLGGAGIAGARSCRRSQYDPAVRSTASRPAREPWADGVRLGRRRPRSSQPAPSLVGGGTRGLGTVYVARQPGEGVRPAFGSPPRESVERHGGRHVRDDRRPRAGLAGDGAVISAGRGAKSLQLVLPPRARSGGDPERAIRRGHRRATAGAGARSPGAGDPICAPESPAAGANRPGSHRPGPPPLPARPLAPYLN